MEVEPDRENEILAKRRNIYAFVPSTPEGKSLAKTIKALDAAFLEYRTKAAMQDMDSVNAAFDAMRVIVKEFHDMTVAMTKKTETKFSAPRAYESYMSRGVN